MRATEVREAAGQLADAGFFAWRTPLLPLEALVAWGAGLEAPSVGEDEEARLAAALERDRERLRERLRAIVGRADVREALFLASPSLDESLPRWLAAPASERGRKVEPALVRYIARMAGRPTPFGLFAGTSLGEIGSDTRLELGARHGERRRTRLDMGYVSALAASLAREPAVRSALRHRPNTSLYEAGGQLRYAAARDGEAGRSYELVAVEPTPAIRAALERSAGGARPDEITATVADIARVPHEAAAGFVDALIERQILVAELEPALTGDEQIHDLAAQLGDHPAGAALAAVADALGALDAAGVGVPPERYRALARRLDALPAAKAARSLFQVDLVRPAAQARLGRAVVDEIVRGAEALRRLAGAHEDARLARFREAFRERWGEREVPLAVALDDESGVGFGGSGDVSPLLAGLPLDGARAAAAAEVGPAHALLLDKLARALERGDDEIALSPEELPA